MTRLLIRNSERSSFKTCRFRWAVTFGGVFEGIGPLQSREPAKALWFGDLIHQAQARYFKPGTRRGPHPARTFIRLYDADPRLAAVLKNDEGEWESMRDLGRGMLEGYVEHFAVADAEWEVLSSEQTFQLPIKINGRVAFWVVGTFDGVWRHRVERRRIAFKEFKTASTISTDGLSMDEQASYYWTFGPRFLWLKKILPVDVYPSEILYTFLRKAIRNTDKTYDSQGRVLNKPTKDELVDAFPRLLTHAMKLDDMIEKIGPRALLVGQPSKSQPPPYFHREPVYRDLADRTHCYERVLAEVEDMILVRANPQKAYKNPGMLHMPNCRGCAIRDACELHETGHDWLAMLRQTTTAWDPYAAHELIERR